MQKIVFKNFFFYTNLILISSQIQVRGKYCLSGLTIFLFDGPGILIEPTDGIVGTGEGPIGIGILPDGGSNGKILSFGRIGLNLLLCFSENIGKLGAFTSDETRLYIIGMHLYCWFDSITHLS